MKECKTCKQSLPLSDFYYHKTAAQNRRQHCKKCLIKITNEYRRNSPKMREAIKKHRSSPEYKAYVRAYISGLKKNNPQVYLASILRNRLLQALKKEYTRGKTLSDLGCDISFLKSYLEKGFQEGMSWDNRGEWHIDHIKPLSSFDLTDQTQFSTASHYSNLQPLWKRDNISKGNRVLLKGES